MSLKSFARTFVQNVDSGGGNPASPEPGLSRDHLLAALPDLLKSPASNATLSAAMDGLIRRNGCASALSLCEVLATGDGTLAQPWEVIMCRDEDDVLELLGKDSQAHEHLLAMDGRPCHVHLCTDGTYVAFVPLSG